MCIVHYSLVIWNQVSYTEKNGLNKTNTLFATCKRRICLKVITFVLFNSNDSWKKRKLFFSNECNACGRRDRSSFDLQQFFFQCIFKFLHSKRCAIDVLRQNSRYIKFLYTELFKNYSSTTLVLHVYCAHWVYRK